jgi:uncharacterized RDD family membrane protein YckC
MDAIDLVTTTDENPSLGLRLGSMAVDHFLMSFVVVIFFSPLFISYGNSALSHERNNFMSPNSFYTYLTLFGISLYFNKDCINGRSIAKRILKLQIIDLNSGQVARPLKCLVRNLTSIIWPIEIIMTMIDPSRRLGDRLAGTQVVRLVNQEYQTQRLKSKPIIGSLILSWVFVLVIFFVFGDFTNTKIVENSFNLQESNKVEQLLKDRLNSNLQPSVKIYDEIRNDNRKYVSIVVQSEVNFIDSKPDFDETHSNIKSVLENEYNTGTFICKVKYVYKIPGHIRIKTMEIR